MSIEGEGAPTFDLRAVETGIASTQFARRVMHFPSVGSTNALALEAAQAGTRDGVWVADEQTAGRGRGGHGWHSVAGDGLYLSALVAPPLPMTTALRISLATGLAAKAAIAEATGLDCDIRWPNDLMLNGRKCGGILVETGVVPAEGNAAAMLRYAVIGVGINLNHVQFSPELESVATSLRREMGERVSREVMLTALLRWLDEEIRGLNDASGQDVLQRFAAASSWVRGKRVRVEEGGGYTGLTDGLDSQGFLRVTGDDGVERTVLSGGVRDLKTRRMQNYFNYFTEIEERFQQRRGSLLMLSTLDWALIETWREAGVPLEAVLRGIDSAFDKHDAKAMRAKGRARKVNGLAWCSQSVMEAVEQAREASIGAATSASAEAVESGFETERVVVYLNENAEKIEAAVLSAPANSVAVEVATRLRALAVGLRAEPLRSLEELDRTLSVLEEKMFASLVTSADEDEMVALREQATRELAPYRGKMQAIQIKQVQQQFLQKRMLEARKLPRLSLFYMSHR